MENEKIKGAPQCSEVFKEAIDRLPDVKAFIDVVAGAIDDIGASALRSWYKTESETKSQEDLTNLIKGIIDGGCYDEHEFRHKLAETCPQTFNETDRTHESCTHSNTTDENPTKKKLNTYESIFDEWDKKDEFCGEITKFRDEIETEVKAAVTAGHAGVFVIRGPRMTGKSRLLKSISSRLSSNENKIIIVPLRDVLNKGERAFNGDNRKYLVVCDNFDTELLENPPAMELRIERTLQAAKASFLFTMTDTSKLSVLVDSTQVHDMPPLSVKSVSETLSEHLIREKKLSLESCTKMVNLLATHSPAEALQENGFHALRLVMYKQLTENADAINGMKEITVTDADLQAAAESVLGISFKLESASECRRKIEEELVGQRKTIDRITPFLDIIHSGFSDPEKPLGVFMFYGPSGVGKTELAKIIANSMFGGRYYKEDMNTYSERHSVSRLIGSPPGYVGHGDSSALMKFIDKEPSGVILLDEIEKAHQDVREALMELMDTGYMRDAAGKQHDARRFLIIMTSNIGLREKVSTVVGFANKKKAEEEDKNEVNDKIDREYLVNEGTFTKELIGRIQLVSKFSLFSDDEKKEVARRLVRLAGKRLTKFLESKGKTLTDKEIENYSNEALNYYSVATGARGMKTYIDTTITSKILGIVKD